MPGDVVPDATQSNERALKTLLLLSAIALVVMFLGSGCASANRAGLVAPDERTPSRATAGKVQMGEASFYDNKFHGRRTASGERYDKSRLTAAHRTYPFGTTLRVTHLGNRRTVIVRVNDRGPFARGRIIDLSLAAARRLEMIRSGTARVKVEIITDRPISSRR
ncbi:MAG: septal ring lytic transglycosylase RlpA family protein [Verrucomicrobia subdivision 3 bacterium]|nr:septal ring lytic transglycosylase RlpA family protein [Limisphaerales bacterium]